MSVFGFHSRLGNSAVGSSGVNGSEGDLAPFDATSSSLNTTSTMPALSILHTSNVENMERDISKLYHQLVEQNTRQSDMVKLYNPTGDLSDTLKVTNAMAFNILFWIFSQIPLTSRYSKGLKKTFEKVFTQKTFVSLVTSQMHKQLNANTFTNGIVYKNNQSEELVQRMNALHKRLIQLEKFSSQLMTYFKQAWTRQQAESLGQFFLDIGVVENIKPEKKKKFTERSHYYMFSMETIEYFGDLMIESDESNREQQEVLSHWKREENSFSTLAIHLNSPFLNRISGSSIHLSTIGESIQRRSLQYMLQSQQKEYEYIKQHIKKSQEYITEETPQGNTNILPEDSPLMLSDPSTSAFSVVFRNGHQRSVSRDHSKQSSAPETYKRASLNLSHSGMLNIPAITPQTDFIDSCNDKQPVPKKEYPPVQPTQETESKTTPRGTNNFYEKYGIPTKITSIQQALENPIIVEELSEFCIRDHSEENILCWKEIQHYQKLSTLQERLEKARSIFNQFIDDSNQNATPINISHTSKESMKKKIGSQEIEIFTTDFFREVEIGVVNDMQDIFKRFNEERNQKIDSEIDKLQETLRTEAIFQEKQSKSFMSQVTNAAVNMFKNKRTSSSTQTVGNTKSNKALLTSSYKDEELCENILSSMSTKQFLPTKLSSRRLNYLDRKNVEVKRLPLELCTSLELVLTNKEPREEFKKFCLTEHSEPPLLFYEAVEDYKLLESKFDLIEKAHEIFDTFVEEKTHSVFDDPEESDSYSINCSKDLRESLRGKLDSGDITLFDQLSLSMQSEMIDTFDRFVMSQKEWKARKLLL